MGFYCHGCASLYNEIKKLEAQIENPWFDVTEKMPKVGVAVFVWTGSTIYPRVGFRVRASKSGPPWKVGGLYEKNVTHWMPMIARPRTKGK